MPEGPEIKRVADELAEALVGKKLVDVFFAFDHLKPWESALCGRRVQRVRPRGKALLTEFGDRTIYSHNQLYGRWFVAERGAEPKTGRQLRLALHTRHHACLLYSASDIEVLDAGEMATHSFLSKLGPDVLDSDTTGAAIAARYAEPTFQGRQLGALLLDQGFLAGLGNYLRSEILFCARVHPLRRLGDVSSAARAALAQHTLALTQQSYDTQGVTNDLASYRAMRNAGRTFAESRHWVFARQGESCYECGETIEKISVNSRRLYFCTHCQTE